jgi:hypothetical protein
MLDKTLKPLKEQLKTEVAVISPLNTGSGTIRIKGTAPLVMNKFSSANRAAMIATQEEGSRAGKGKKRQPKDFDAVYRGAMHIGQDGSYGMPVGAIRNALISACRVAGFQMTRAKLSLFVQHDTLDTDDFTPLVKIHGEPVRRDIPVRLANGATDILARPFFLDWYADVKLRWDADQFSASDVINLMIRAGEQVGLGAGRPDSKASCGMGWGTFEVRVDEGSLAKLV